MVIKYGPWTLPAGESCIPWNWIGPLSRVQSFGAYDGVPESLHDTFHARITAGDGPSYRLFWLYHQDGSIDRLALGEDQAGFVLGDDGKTLDRC